MGNLCRAFMSDLKHRGHIGRTTQVSHLGMSDAYVARLDFKVGYILRRLVGHWHLTIERDCAKNLYLFLLYVSIHEVYTSVAPYLGFNLHGVFPLFLSRFQDF